MALLHEAIVDLLRGRARRSAGCRQLGFHTSRWHGSRLRLPLTTSAAKNPSSLGKRHPKPEDHHLATTPTHAPEVAYMKSDRAGSSPQ
eukprot:CAMPEP_0115592242 /NCGR_PEP_ID=MMETSP0272-20121206/10688_1 /TAXON_ID=71861 /ORGANISM="Scrippsiella trochoidea, Strain CCMP3099" /LENGTH=87 /DNA_ID=CAMNT_0003027481 /DNA_START=291 /DNA_END=552 /DNA_ORIENTATION=+